MFKSYFSSEEIKSYGALTNLTLSDRSDGKTLDIKASGFVSYLKDKSQFVYLRRWKSELSCDLYETFYNELIDKVEKNEYVGYPEVYEIINYEFLGTKRGVYIRKKGDKNWDLICYFMPLTMTGKKKSSLDITRIKKIEYDEFVPLDSRYIPNEMHLLIEFYKSVDRDRDTTLLNLYGNRIDNFNPFFDFFDIHLGIEKEKIRLYKNGTIAVQIYMNKEHREERKKSRFNSMIENTSYENYNNGGVLNNALIKIGNTNGCFYFASFKSSLGEGCIFYNEKQIVISSKKRKDGSLIVDKIYNTGRDEYLVTYGNIPNFIKDRVKRGNIYYDNEKTYHIFEPLLHKIGGIR